MGLAVGGISWQRNRLKVSSTSHDGRCRLASTTVFFFVEVLMIFSIMKTCLTVHSTFNGYELVYCTARQVSTRYWPWELEERQCPFWRQVLGQNAGWRQAAQEGLRNDAICGCDWSLGSLAPRPARGSFSKRIQDVPACSSTFSGRIKPAGKDRIRGRASFELHPECSPGKNGPCPAISQREKTAYAEGPLSNCIQSVLPAIHNGPRPAISQRIAPTETKADRKSVV